MQEDFSFERREPVEEMENALKSGLIIDFT